MATLVDSKKHLKGASGRDEGRQLDDLCLLGLPAGVLLVAEGEGGDQLRVELVTCGGQTRFSGLKSCLHSNGETHIEKVIDLLTEKLCHTNPTKEAKRLSSDELRFLKKD